MELEDLTVLAEISMVVEPMWPGAHVGVDRMPKASGVAW
jgi:hypothetical protein